MPLQDEYRPILVQFLLVSWTLSLCELAILG